MREPPPDYGDTAAQLRVPPHSIEAESSVLGGLLLDATAWDRAGDIVQEDDFYRHEHKLIFAVVRDLLNANKPADVVTVSDRLDALGKLADAGGLAYLGGLAAFVPHSGNMRRYAEIVRERSVLRKLVSASDEIASSAFNTEGKTVEAVVDAAQQKIFGIAETQVAARDDWEGTDVGMVGVLDRIQAQADGTAAPDFMPTGLRQLDHRLDGGMRGGELIVIGARPSMGKSAMGLTIAVHVGMKEGKPVGVFSMEMPKAQVHNRMLSLVSHIHLSRIKRGERIRDYDWPKLTEGVEKLAKSPIFVSDASNLNINQLRARARGLQRRNGKLGCLVIDYLGLMAGTDAKAPRAYQLEEVTKGLKALAKELDIPVLLLVQVNRKVEERVDQMPMLSDIRDSGSVEQDADIVVFVHREYKAKPGMSEEWKYHAKVGVAKVRDGEPGQLDLMYIGENTRFMDWPDETPLPTSPMRTAGKKDL